MTKKHKAVVELTSIYITCGGFFAVVPAALLMWHSCTSECEVCGSHGDISVSFDCPICGNEHEIEVKDW